MKKRTLIQPLRRACLVLPVLILLIAGGETRPAGADDRYLFEEISIDQGLSQSIVKAILQDRRGFMWFGTEDGLNRYDGYEFVVFRHDPEDPHTIGYNDITSLREDGAGLLWIGTFHGGLSRYDPATGKFRRFQADASAPDSLSNENVNAIVVDAAGTVWVATDAGLNRLHPQSETWTSYRHDPRNPASLADDRVLSLLVDRSGILWIGTAGGLDRLDLAAIPGRVELVGDNVTPRFRRLRHDPADPHSLSAGGVRALLEDEEGTLWVGTDGGGLNRYDKSTGSFTRYRNDPDDPGSLSNNRVIALCEDGVGNFWVGTRGGGLNRLDRQTGRFVTFRNDPQDPTSLGQDHVFALLADASGVLWIGTYGGGANKILLENKPFVTHSHDPEDPGALGHDIVWTLCEDRAGLLWVGTHGSGLDCLDRSQGRITHYRSSSDDPHGLSSNIVRNVFEDHAGALWIGTHGGGLNVLDRQTGRFASYQENPADPHSLSCNEIRSIYEDRSGVLWIGTYGGGLEEFDRESGTFTHHRAEPEDPTTLSNDIVRTIFEDPDEAGEVLWVGTEGGGLNRLDRRRGTFKRYRNVPDDPTSLSEDHVFSIHEDRAGNFWIGTFAGGLNRFDREAEVFTSYSTEDGLPSNAIYGILEDELGCLWLSTNHGLSRFDPRGEIFRNYDARDGLQSNEFNGGAYHRSQSGEMFFGGINGFNAFFPREIVDNPHQPSVVITDLQIFNKSVEIGAEIGNSVVLTRAITATDAVELSFREKIFTFEFAGLHYVSPQQNRYAYMMEGFEEDWNYVGDRRFATYTSLPPGEYTFRVKAANSDGIWNEQGASLQLTVTPPFWQTAWFRIAGLGFVSGLVLAAHRLRTRSIRRRNRRLQNELAMRRKAEEAMRQAMVAARNANQVKSEFLANISHEFRTPMNGIIGMTNLALQDDLTPELREYLEVVQSSAGSLFDIMNNLLDFSRIESGSLDPDRINFNLPNLLADVTEPLRNQAWDKGLELEVELAPDLPASLMGDQTCLQQVLKQVIGNAIKFTEQGGVTVRVSRERTEGEEARPALRPDSRAGNGDDSRERVRLQFSVRDTGIGIPEENLETIFESFRQVDGSFTRTHGGTGIGLSICRKMLRLMDGSIRVESELGKGSTFHLSAGFLLGALEDRGRAAETDPGELAADTGVEIPATEQPAVGGEATASRRILLVEDMPLNQRVARGILEKAGHQVAVAANGEEALNLLEEAHFDLVLMDIQMPVMNGFEATERIRSSESAIRDLPIIALTAHTLEGDRRRCLDAGMDGYVPKPVKSKVLYRTIDRVLEMKCAC